MSLQCWTSILWHLFPKFIVAIKSTFAVLLRSGCNMLRIRYIQRRRLKVPASYCSPVNHMACAKDTTSDMSKAWARPLPQRVPPKRIESWYEMLGGGGTISAFQFSSGSHVARRRCFWFRPAPVTLWSRLDTPSRSWTGMALGSLRPCTQERPNQVCEDGRVWFSCLTMFGLHTLS